ncbi:MAG: LPS-assembly protein LptD [Steroidobacteraceae bacterium]
MPNRRVHRSSFSAPAAVVLLSMGLPAVVGAADADCEQPPADQTPATPAATRAVDANAPIEIESDRSVLGLNGNATVSGRVTVRQGDREIHADEMEYSQEERALTLRGNIEYEDPLLRLRGRNGNYATTGGADFQGAEFELKQRGARGRADNAALGLDGLIALRGVSFTSCPRDDEAWALEADSITLDPRRRNGVGRGARVRFKGVPILYTPWISFPIGTQRKSGFLFPNVGNSSRSGFELQTPYYVNIAPNIDATFEPRLYSKRGVELGGELRYLDEHSLASLTARFLPGDRAVAADLASNPLRSSNRDRSFVQLRQETRLPGDWRMLIDAANVSDREYFEDFGQGPEGTSQPFVPRNLALRYRDNNWRLGAEIQHFQTLDRSLTPLEQPYASLPRLAAAGQYWVGPGHRLGVGMDAELVNFDRDAGVTGWRMDLAPRLSLDWAGSGYFLRPTAGFRVTNYQLDGTAPGEARSPSRRLPFASLDGGLILERRNSSSYVTLEPRALYLYTPFRAQDDLPVFDTALPDGDLVQLFRDNRYVGPDRVSDANQLSLGVTARYNDLKTGRQKVAASIGQIYYFSSPRVRLPDEVTAERRSSDLIAQLSVNALSNWYVDLATQWNTDLGSSERAQAQLRYQSAANRVVNLGYRMQRDRLRQAEFSAAWPVARNLQAFARIVRDLDADQAIEKFAGLEYRACCWGLRLVARRFVSSRTGEQDTGIYLQLELTGLASVGVPADAFLERSIRGYSPPRQSR